MTLLSCSKGPESFNIDMLYLVPAHSSSVFSIFNLSLFADIQLSMSVMQRSSLGVVVAISSVNVVSLNILLSHSRSFEMTLLSRACISPDQYFIETMPIIGRRQNNTFLTNSSATSIGGSYTETGQLFEI